LSGVGTEVRCKISRDTSEREHVFATFSTAFDKMMVRGSRAMNEAVLLIALVFLSALYSADAEVIFKRSHLRMQKLCSRKLSDAMYVVCLHRGYNEPFSYSNEDEPRADPGPGLVEECCYHQCTYEQLEQYCKPLPEEKRINSREDVM